MCKVFAISCSKKEDLTEITNYLLIYFSHSNKDGSGIAYIENNKIILDKSKENGFNFVMGRYGKKIKTKCLIGHLRSATSGSVSDNNAHPFLNESKTLALAHNGILYDYENFKKELEKTHIFTSETDSEILLHSFEEYGFDFIKKLKQNKVKGYANFVILDKNGFLYCYGDFYIVEMKNAIIVLQEKLFKKSKKLKDKCLYIIKNGRIKKIINIGKLENYVSTWYYYDNYYYYYYNDKGDKEVWIKSDKSEDYERLISEKLNVEYCSLFVRFNKNRVKIEYRDNKNFENLKKFFSCFPKNEKVGIMKLKTFMKKLELLKGVENPNPT